MSGEAAGDLEAKRVMDLMMSLVDPYPEVPPDREMGPIEKLFWSDKARPIHKWRHYLPLYDRYMARFRGKPIRMLEIGVAKGGSLWLWRKVLGEGATIFGVDIDPDCARFDGRFAQVRIGSQDDPAFLNRVVDEMGGIDVVLDDGSHDSRHIRTTLDTLFPRLNDGGLYIVEDLHAAYWPFLSGGHGAPTSFWEAVKAMIDDMHHWYHDRGESIAATAGHLAGIHIHDSMVVLEKAPVARPSHLARMPRKEG